MKQYLMLCDEVGLEKLQAIFKPESVQFLEVQGMPVGTSNQYNLLVTPVIAPVNPMGPITPPVPTPEPEVSPVEKVTSV